LKINIYIVFFILICSLTNNFAQSDTIVLPDTFPDIDLNSSILDSFVIDSLNLISLDSLGEDSLGLSFARFKLSKDSLEAEVKYGSRDSSWIDLVHNRIHLYGAAYVEYTTIKVEAKYIVFDFTANVLEAFSEIPADTTKSTKPQTIEDEDEIDEVVLPTFTDGQNRFSYKTMRYNFKSKKAFVTKAITKEDEFYLHGAKTKFVTKDLADSTRTEDVVYNQDAYITTCDLPHPHFGIRSSKLKFIPNKLAVMSFAQLEIQNIPTPLFLPFGFFPLAKGKSAGLIFPRNFEYTEQLGLGFREIGYYFPINDYMDLRVTGDIYTRGSYGIRSNLAYKKRYGYTGFVNLGFNNTITEDLGTGLPLSAKAFTIQLRHDQDPKAHPYRRIGGSINIQTNSFDQRTNFNPQFALQNVYQSNFTYSNSMPGTPFSFNAEFRHLQRTNDRSMEVTLPNITLRMNSINPFKSKNATKEKWYDNIVVSYGAELRNKTLTTDTTLFTMEAFENMVTGMKQNASVSSNFRVLKYFNLTPTVNYEEFWLTSKIRQEFDPTPTIVEDRDTLGDLIIITPRTIRFGNIDTIQERGVFAYRKFNANVALFTQVYSTMRFRKGFVRGIRHHAKPNISFGYNPDGRQKYERTVDVDSRPEFNRPRMYGIFQNSAFGTLRGDNEQMAINYSVLNIFEAKYNLKDSVRNMKLLENITLSGFYNMAADSQKWSDVRISGNTMLFKGLTNVFLSANFSPYKFENNFKTNNTLWETDKQLLGFRDFNINFSTNVTFAQVLGLFKSKEVKNENENEKSTTSVGPAASNLNNIENAEAKQQTKKKEKYKDMALADWFANFGLGHSYAFAVQRINGKDTTRVTSNVINLRGSLPITKNWRIDIGSVGYDFAGKRLTYPYFVFNRDLHCWTMNFTWAPDAGTYGFFIGVKSSSLEFLKYNYGQRNVSGSLLGRR